MRTPKASKRASSFSPAPRPPQRPSFHKEARKNPGRPYTHKENHAGRGAFPALPATKATNPQTQGPGPTPPAAHPPRHPSARVVLFPSAPPAAKALVSQRGKEKSRPPLHPQGKPGRAGSCPRPTCRKGDQSTNARSRPHPARRKGPRFTKARGPKSRPPISAGETRRDGELSPPRRSLQGPRRPRDAPFPRCPPSPARPQRALQ